VFLNDIEFTAIAVVHGLGATAPWAFDLAKQRHAMGRGVIWLPDPKLLPLLTGEDAVDLKRVLEPESGMLMTFFNVKDRVVKGRLKWFHVSPLAIDEKFLEAGLG
jgi:hypothetical protein